MKTMITGLILVTIASIVLHQECNNGYTMVTMVTMTTVSVCVIAKDILRITKER